jgi:hypothetical protein
MHRRLSHACATYNSKEAPVKLTMLNEDMQLLFIGWVLWVKAPDDQGMCRGALASPAGR